MRLFYMNVDTSDIYLLINGDEVSTAWIDPSSGIERYDLSHHGPEYVEGFFKAMGGTGRLEEVTV